MIPGDCLKGPGSRVQLTIPPTFTRPCCVSPGRLGQLGLKEGFPTAVKNISSVIGMFIQHARDEGKSSGRNSPFLDPGPYNSKWGVGTL